MLQKEHPEGNGDILRVSTFNGVQLNAPKIGEGAEVDWEGMNVDQECMKCKAPDPE